ncbi:MAG: hypothetical protein V1909_06650 [Candidatus Micrarchaeota archaeon]
MAFKQEEIKKKEPTQPVPLTDKTTKEVKQQISEKTKEASNILGLIPSKTKLDVKQFIDTQHVVLNDLTRKVGKDGLKGTALLSLVEKYADDINRMTKQTQS